MTARASAIHELRYRTSESDRPDVAVSLQSALPTQAGFRTRWALREFSAAGISPTATDPLVIPARRPELLAALAAGPPRAAWADSWEKLNDQLTIPILLHDLTPNLLPLTSAEEVATAIVRSPDLWFSTVSAVLARRIQLDPLLVWRAALTDGIPPRTAVAIVGRTLTEPEKRTGVPEDQPLSRKQVVAWVLHCEPDVVAVLDQPALGVHVAGLLRAAVWASDHSPRLRLACVRWLLAEQLLPAPLARDLYPLLDQEAVAEHLAHPDPIVRAKAAAVVLECDRPGWQPVVEAAHSREQHPLARRRMLAALA